MALDVGHEKTAPSGTALAAGPGWVERLLRTPLLGKIVFLDAAIDVFVLVMMVWAPPEFGVELTAIALVVQLVTNAVLVVWALSPLRALEETARRVSAGEFHARVGPTAELDRDLARIARTFDALLDRVSEDRERLRRLTSEVVATSEQERARLARELHDGTAQSLSALDMLLAATQAETADAPPAVRARLAQLKEITTDALVEVRALVQSVHPRVLDDLGLPAALAYLARRAHGQSHAEVEVVTEGDTAVPKPIASALYRVAQEALHNAVKHAHAAQVDVTLRLSPGHATLIVADDGLGFDPAAIAGDRRGMGLFVMEERVGLAGGRLTVTSRPGEGTVVRADVPLQGGAT